jgi:two-component system chemotaxis response regulator CheB
MTLDIEMPRMNGLTFLRKLLPQYPMPVIVVSYLDDRVFDALEAGAVDFVFKPGGLTRTQLFEYIKAELGAKIKAINRAKIHSGKRREATVVAPDQLIGRPDKEVIVIGAATGGTEAVYDIVSRFNNDIPGTVVALQMPAGFTGMYAERLNSQCKVAVKEAQNGDRIKYGQVLVAPGDKQIRLAEDADGFHIECRFAETTAGTYTLSINKFFNSVANVAKERAIGVILTGMGSDGAAGLMEMHRHGAVTIGQDELSSIIYEMPKVAYEMGALTYQTNLSQIAEKIYSVLNHRQ